MKVIILLLGDILFFYAALYGTLLLRYYPAPITRFTGQHELPFTIIFVVWLLLFGAFGLYDMRLVKNGKRFLYRLVHVMSINFVLAILFFYLLPAWEIEPRRNLFMIAGIATSLIFIWRYLFNLLVIHTPASRILFFGAHREVVLLADYLLKNPQLGQRPVGFVANGELKNISTPFLPSFTLNNNLNHIVFDTRADIIVVSHKFKEDKQLVKMLFDVIPSGISVIEFPRFYEMCTGKIPLSLIEEVWFLENLIGRRKSQYEFSKRIFDILLALTAGSVALAAFPFVAAGIVLSTPRDIRNYKQTRARPGDGILFFRQRRVGKNGQEFDFIKLRSQRLGSERISAELHEAKEITNDPRQYGFGKLMRKTYLDELGQVWNVLKGEMSFVGPRPERPKYVTRLKEQTPFYEMRLLVTPGITGWAQIHMENDAAVEDAPEKMQYDLYYIKNRSLRLDLLIILRTLFAIIRRQGR